MKNSAASLKLKDEWAATIQEVLGKFSPDLFGWSPTLDVARATYGRDKAEGWVMIPITGDIGFWHRRKDTGVAYIRGGAPLEIELRDKREECRTLAVVPCPTREEMKRQLFEYVPLLEKLKVG